MQKLLTIDEVAQMLKLQKTTLYDWVHKGKIRYVKVGRLVRFLEEDIAKIIVIHPIDSTLEWS